MSAQVSPPKPMNVTVSHEYDHLTAAPRKKITRTNAICESKLTPRRLVYEALSPKISVEEVDVDELFGADDASSTERTMVGVAYTEDKVKIFLFDDGTYEVVP